MAKKDNDTQWDINRWTDNDSRISRNSGPENRIPAPIEQKPAPESLKDNRSSNERQKRNKE